MSTATLPADIAKEGNVWCEPCQQSLAPSRAAAHLISKKHTDCVTKKTGGLKAASPTGAPPAAAKQDPAPLGGRTQPAKKAGGLKATSPTDAAPAEEVKAAKPKKVRSTESKDALPRDPNDETKHWCGLCQVSLGPVQAAKHLTTKTHLTNATNHLTSAMKGAKIK
jgi:hypothetical protein